MIDLSSLYQIPKDRDSLKKLYHFTDTEHALISQRRGDHNRLGFAVLMSLLKYPGHGDCTNSEEVSVVVKHVARSIRLKPSLWNQYSKRDKTVWEHREELRNFFSLYSFSKRREHELRKVLFDQALFNDDSLQLGERAVQWCQEQRVVLPTQTALEQIVHETSNSAKRELYKCLTESLTSEHREALDSLCTMRNNVSHLVWLKDIPLRKNSNSVLYLLERITFLNEFALPFTSRDRIPQHRLKQLSDEGVRMRTSDLKELESVRRSATLFAVALEQRARLIDLTIIYHESIVGQVFKRVKRDRDTDFLSKGKSLTKEIGSLKRLAEILIAAKKEGLEPYEQVEREFSWESLETAVTQVESFTSEQETEIQGFARKHTTFNRYMPKLLSQLVFHAAPGSGDLLTALHSIAKYHSEGKRTVPDDLPRSFIPSNWKKEVVAEDSSLLWKMYELCTYTVLNKRLRTGDIWIEGARQFRSFDADLVEEERFASLHLNNQLELPVHTSADAYLEERLTLLTNALGKLDKSAQKGIPGVKSKDGGLSIERSNGEDIPEGARLLAERVKQRMPRIKITNLLKETDEMTGFTTAFTHLKRGNAHGNKPTLWSVVLADGINLGLKKMSEAITGISYDQLAWTQAWYTREDTYQAALAVLTNAQSSHSLSHYWGDGTTSSSDGQRFATGSRASATGSVNPKYGSAPGRLYYTHISDTYAPYHSALVRGRLRDSTYVLDGLLSHKSDLSIQKHSTDTLGFTDHLFGLTHLLGFSFQPRIKDVKTTKLFAPKKGMKFKSIESQVSATPINSDIIRENWGEILRIAYSVKEGTVKASSILQKLGGFPRANRIANALSEIGRIERTLFLVQWYLDADMRRETTAILNKGEARNSLARAVHFHRHGEIRDVTPEQQLHRATGLTLVTSAIIYWNTVQLERVIKQMRREGSTVDSGHIKYLSPLGWDHINLTGDYIWRN